MSTSESEGKANKSAISASKPLQYTPAIAQTIAGKLLQKLDRLLWGSATWNTRDPQPSTAGQLMSMTQETGSGAMAAHSIYKGSVHIINAHQPIRRLIIRRGSK